MNRWLFSSGAIVSSAVALYGWMNPSTFNLTLLSAQLDQDSKPLPGEIEGLYDRMLKKARTVATDDQLAEAITAVAGIPKNSRSYGEAQQLQEDWTQELLQRARDQYKQANCSMAIWMLKAIPPNSERYERATELQQRWTKEWSTFRQASAAKKQGDWKGVMTSLASLKDSVLYQSFPAQEMLQQATANLYSADKTLVQINSVPVDQAVMVPAIPSTAELDTASLPMSATSPNLLIGRSQALAWAEPPALMAGSPTGMRSYSNGSMPRSGASAPEFVPLEWAPPALAPSLPEASQPTKPLGNGDGNTNGSPDNMADRSLDPISEPSAISQPTSPSSNPIAPTDWMGFLPLDLMPSAETPAERTNPVDGDRLMEMYSVPIAPAQMSWGKSVTEKPTPIRNGQTSTICPSAVCNSSQPQVLPINTPNL
ncbi:MAG: hypothetical protein HY785_06725 [Oscillatoriophycideae cyanobacterium NC_groundwater_1537_Pr4_S-0.65um_50_18]|nr:hypothetical protein [Oscillatoriophycideae cyanobacterium NC_groundwater_1537_Pr4_S-0.65um_50_18]